MWNLIGIVGGVFAFLFTAVTWDHFDHGSNEFVAGLLAGSVTYFFCMKKHMEEVDQLCNPPSEVWPVSLDVAWGCVRDVLKSVMGPSSWHTTEEDDSRGIISAEINYMQELGGPTDRERFPRSVKCSVFLTPEGTSTRVRINYVIFSPMGDGSVKDLIRKTQLAFHMAARANQDSA